MVTEFNAVEWRRYRRSYRTNRNKIWPKLKTPETEASGVSILITRQCNRCCALRLPQRPTSSFRWRRNLWLRWRSVSNLRRRPALQLDRGPTLRLGSVSCLRLGRHAPLACTSVPRYLSTGGDPSGLRLTILVPSSLRRMDPPPAWPTTYLRLASETVLWLVWQPHPACAVCVPTPPAGSSPRIAPAAFTFRLHRPSDRPARASRSLLRLSLRCTPCFH